MIHEVISREDFVTPISVYVKKVEMMTVGRLIDGDMPELVQSIIKHPQPISTFSVSILHENDITTRTGPPDIGQPWAQYGTQYTTPLLRVRAGLWEWSFIHDRPLLPGYYLDCAVRKETDELRAAIGIHVRGPRESAARQVLLPERLSGDR